jgi:hypothetical protein
MPQCKQKVCWATPVPKLYTVNAFLPCSNSKCSSATGRCGMPFVVQIEQSHWDSKSRSTRGPEAYPAAMATSLALFQHYLSSSARSGRYLLASAAGR